MIDPEMKYCLACDDEYMPHVEKCGVCGAALVSGSELRKREREREKRRKNRRNLTPNDDLVIVFNGDLGEAKRIEHLLGQECISAMLAGEGPSCGKGCCGGSKAQVLVHREDGMDAMRVIEDDFKAMTAIDQSAVPEDRGFDPSAGEHSCPACGHTFATTTSTCPDCGLCFV